MSEKLLNVDPEIAAILDQEADRQENGIELIASENVVSRAVMEAQGSVLTNKYAEGYPAKRYYGGCAFADAAESLAIERAKTLFNAEYVNVQPHSGSQANMAALMSMVEPGDTILGMDLAHGGHLTHGSPVNFSGKLYNFVHYGVSRSTGTIDYDRMAELAREHRPKVIIAGASAYPRIIDFDRFAEVAASCEAYFMVDMAHIAGLVAAGLIPSPIPWADFVTMTCYKTMMGGRGGIILCRHAFAKQIDKAVFPGCQGTSAVSGIAAKAVILKYARNEDFIATQKKTIAIAKAMACRFGERGYHVVTDGTDTHQVLLDVTKLGINGSQAETALENANIIVNRNIIPGDEQHAAEPSGIRIGTAAMAARGLDETQAVVVADLIAQILTQVNNPDLVARIKAKVASLCRQHPVYVKPAQNDR